MAFEAAFDQVAETDRQADQLGLVGHQHQLHAVAHGEAGDDGAVAVFLAGRANVGEAHAAAPDGAVFVGRGDLAVAIGGEGEDELLVLLRPLQVFC